MTDRLQIAIPLFPRFTALDAVGPYEVLQRIPYFDLTFVGHEPGEVRSENGMLGLSIDAAFEELPTPDVIVFPGGVGTRTLENDERVVQWVRDAHRTTRFTTSVCTGSLVLGAAGLLARLDCNNALVLLRQPRGPRCPRHARTRHRASRRAHHHGGRRLQRHRHGPAADRAPGRPDGGAGGPAHDRVRPATASGLRLGGQVRRRGDDAGHRVRRAPPVTGGREPAHANRFGLTDCGDRLGQREGAGVQRLADDRTLDAGRTEVGERTEVVEAAHAAARDHRSVGRGTHVA